ncbi:Putative auto-transporter adhesin, head GIN domain [Microbulbifer donghaiensis]|uniref:Putative auto-transporter adhesin, head GIN domain n=1 Tax=Microbulbifer donghaiensis TaxID=494016 RepID=A0A1M5GN37_9GAMM|nr:DUF2807 domain-containing protein [Microbulbifer donghaiensis]SHG05145.1 Putative auto-transporter adhesin, head GIN domain [Microbulbifer donghaiensis]
MAVKKIVFAPLALLLLIAPFSAASQAKEITSKQFDVSGFSRIALKGSSHVQVIQGERFEVLASGPVEAMPYAKAELHGDTLELSVEDDKKSWFGVITVSSDPEIEYRVTLPKVAAIKVTGSGEATADTLESESLELRVTGSGTIRVDKVAAESLVTTVTGSGDLLVGTALAVKGQASITGSGDLRLDNFAGESLGAEIKGSGDMAIGGRVAELNIHVMGSGDFVGRNLKADSASGSVMGSGDIVIRRPERDSFSVMGSGDIALVD